MKTNSLFFKIICLVMATALLTNCTVYRPVQSGTEKIDLSKSLILHKDELRFVMEEPFVRGDTLFAAVSPLDKELGKHDLVIVVLKPDQELNQMDPGIVAIPFAAIDHLEYFEVDARKTRNARIVGATVSIAVGLTVMGILAVQAASDAMGSLTFKAQDQ